MVVSKDSKRKRKESPLIESSPEMPKRTKVQAQRKFAQGQSAPTSSFSSALASSSTAAAGGSAALGNASAQENREPPTEILPNKRPKTEDFLTFLCFRGTPALPSHLDFLNQNTSQTSKDESSKNTVDEKAKNEDVSEKKLNVQKGTRSKAQKKNEKVLALDESSSTTVGIKKPETKKSSAKKNEEGKVMTFAVRKRAELLPDGNRRGRPTDKSKEKLNKSTEGNRRSIRNRDIPKSLAEPEDDETETNDIETASIESGQDAVKKEKSHTPQQKSKKGKQNNSGKKKPDVNGPNVPEVSKIQNLSIQSQSIEPVSQIKSTQAKEKPLKRPRQKEAPIFVPSPEPTGRMTRQRAFFEPVKVVHREEDDINTEKKKENLDNKIKLSPVPCVAEKDDDNGLGKDIFDFSSEDEQPLAKTIKLKNTKAMLKKTPMKKKQKVLAVEEESPSNADITSRDDVKDKNDPVKDDQEVLNPDSKDKNSLPDNNEEDKSGAGEKTKKSVGRKPKKKLTDNRKVLPEKPPKNINEEGVKNLKKTNMEIEESPEVELKSNATTMTSRQKKKALLTPTVQRTVHLNVDASEPETRNTRPTRKTKEAATIYMGIIGQKLQQDEFEDDELSLNSFPDLPNVKEMEKMETELKKNVDQNKQIIKQTDAGDVLKLEDKSIVKSIEKLPARRGRPPKNQNVKNSKQKPTKPQIEGMLRKREEPKPENKDEKEDEEDYLISEEVNETKRKLEKSFSDSDDEPLAIKLTKSSEKGSDHSKKSDMAPVTKSPTSNDKCLEETKSSPKMLNILPITSPAACLQTHTSPSSLIGNVISDTKAKLDEKPKISNTLPSPAPPYIPRQPVVKSPQTQPPPIPPLPPAIKYQTPPTTYPPPIEAYPSPKINPNFLTPKFDRNIERRIVCLEGSSLSTMQRPSSSFPSPSPVKFDMSSSRTPSTSNPKVPVIPSTTPSNADRSADPLKDEIGSILAANLMPSKEESGKIFGIASVSLAQSSGPDNTKCTLGKCGSIHKPVLGPVVPTESYLGEQLSSKERRKAKVNMTHEQIQKWLIECSSNPDEIQDDLDDDFDDNLRPNIYPTTPPPTRDDKESTTFSSSSKTTRDLGKSESAWSGKGPSLKATPVVVPKDDQRPEESDTANKELQESTKEYQSQKGSSTNKKNETPVKGKEKSKVEKTKEEREVKKLQEKPLKEGVTSRGAKLNPATVAASTQRQQKKMDDNKNNSTSPQTTRGTRESGPAGTPKTPKRTTVYNSKLKETTTTSHKKKSPFSYNFGAFSADNEKSIYCFDKEDDDNKLPMSKPFRRQSRRESHTEEPNQAESLPQKNATGDKKDGNATQTSVSLTLSTEENSKLVKVGLESEESKPVEVTEKLNDFNLGDSDSDIHTFYIPLQGAGVGGIGEGKSDLIQGVAVKLGREGPEGPNQKVVMHATLVTKSQMGSNSKPLPDSMNVSEIVKNLLSSGSMNNKDSNTTVTPPVAPITNPSSATVTSPQQSTLNAQNTTAGTSSSVAVGSSKSVPIGTVQPRFKSAETTVSTQQNHPSGSGGGGGALTRVNSNSSLFSGSNKSRGQSSKKIKDDTPIKMCNNTAFPRHDDPTQMVEAPIFRPTEKEFQDPIEFIDRITPIAARFGICKIIPPSSFKPECRVSDDMRFTAYNQYVHKMLHRWGPSARELSAIKKYLATQSIVMNHPPWIGGMEVDLPRLYHTVQELGGLKEVIEKKKWARVAEEMCIPKLAQDRVTKLDDIYCKYLLPYDTLSPSERQKLFDEVEADWAKREARARRNADRFVNTESVSNEDDDISSEDEEESEEEVDGVSMECIVKGRSMPLSQFYRIARNTMSLWFKNAEPSVTEVEAEFWRHVAVRDSHVCVHSGSIDSSGWGYGFPSPGPKGKGSVCARHPWNLKVLTNNAGSVLRSLGPVTGVTVPTLHVGMLFSACCWYRDPHGLSWIEYLHTGASKLWYGIPDDQSANFRAALTSLIPTHCQNKTIWLPCDTVMVPPHTLTDRGVSLCRIEQKPGEYVVIFPRAYTSSVATGYVVSESVYFATSSWLELGKDDFRDIHDSCEPAMFSLEQLLFALASDQRVTVDVLSQMLPMINEVFEKEVAAREQLKAAGVTSTEKIPTEKTSKSKKHPIASLQNECDLCRANLYISMVKTDEGSIYCLQHALKNLNKGNIQAKQCKLIFSYNIEDIDNLIKTLKDRLAQKRTAANKKSK